MKVTTAGQPRQTVSARSGPEAEPFKEWLVGQLKARKMSQRQLAEKSGVHHSCISRLIRTDRVPSLRTAMSLARAIGRADVGLGPVGGTNVAARVEYALRADDALNEADVREVMLQYLATRMRRPGHPVADAAVTATRPRRDPLVPTVTEANDGSARFAQPSLTRINRERLRDRHL